MRTARGVRALTVAPGAATSTPPAPATFGLSGLFSTLFLHLFIPLLYRLSVFWGQLAWRPEFYSEGGKRTFFSRAGHARG